MSDSKVLTEENFIQGMLSNNDAVMSQLYKLHYPMILNFVMVNNGTEAEAKDIYQEAYIVLYENLQDRNFTLNCKIKTYLYSVCRRLWLKRLSYKGRFVDQLQDNETFIVIPEQEPVAEENELRFAAMEESLQLLGDPCRTLLEDFYIHNLSMVQITEKMGYTNPDNAKNQKYKCLGRLKKIAERLYKKE
jgi:RNA polymerase sigma factor (sigma-70 family)